MSIKSLKSLTGTFKYAFALLLTQREHLPCLGTTQYYFCLKIRNTGLKVYSSDINMEVYGSSQNIANHLLKVIGASSNVCVHYIVSPLGGDK